MLGFAVIPIEPDDATIERVAKALATEHDMDHWAEYAPEARAAYAAVVKGSA